MNKQASMLTVIWYKLNPNFLARISIYVEFFAVIHYFYGIFEFQILTGFNGNEANYSIRMMNKSGLPFKADIYTLVNSLVCGNSSF